MKKNNAKENERKVNKTKKMYKVADSLIACLYINIAEYANTGDSF